MKVKSVVLNMTGRLFSGLSIFFLMLAMLTIDGRHISASWGYVCESKNAQNLCDCVKTDGKYDKTKPCDPNQCNFATCNCAIAEDGSRSCGMAARPPGGE